VLERLRCTHGLFEIIYVSHRLGIQTIRNSSAERLMTGPANATTDGIGMETSLEKRFGKNYRRILVGYGTGDESGTYVRAF
jgi:hypothetical protein